MSAEPRLTGSPFVRGVTHEHYAELLAERAVLAERVSTLERALAEAAIPLEVLRAQIRDKPYYELSAAFQDRIIEATEIVRAGLGADPATQETTR